MIKDLTRENFEALINQCSTTKYPDIFILNIFCRDEETQQLFWNRIKELTAPYDIKSFIDLGRGIVIPKYNNIGGKIHIWPYRNSYPRDMKSTHCIFDWECSYKDVMMNFLYNNSWGNDDAFYFQAGELKEILS